MSDETDATATEKGPHHGQPIETAGAPPQAAEAAVVLLHGRGSSARYMLTLIDEFLHHGVLYLAPQAAHSSWYPRSGYGPLEANEPWLSSGLERISAAFEMASDAGVPPERILVCGFSQGGCLAGEFVVEHPRRYGGLIVLSGSLLGPETDRNLDGDIAGTPVFLGCSDADPHVPAERVGTSAQVFEQLGGKVTYSLYEDLGHAINDAEIQQVNSFIEQLR